MVSGERDINRLACCRVMMRSSSLSRERSNSWLDADMTKPTCSPLAVRRAESSTKLMELHSARSAVRNVRYAADYLRSVRRYATQRETTSHAGSASPSCRLSEASSLATLPRTVSLETPCGTTPRGG